MSEEYRFALLGEGVSYSRSPDIFNAIFAIDGVTGHFETVNCSRANLQRSVQELKDRGCNAFSVTIPHKEAILPYLDEIDGVAEAIGSVNSVCFRDGKALGFNTDTFGFSQQLMGSAGRLKGTSALILGAGGAARSAVYSLAVDYEVKTIALLGRNPERLKSTASRLKTTLPKTALVELNWSSSDLEISQISLEQVNINSLSIIVNATPLGGPNQPLGKSDSMFSALKNKPIYYDLNYNTDNELLHAAGRAGLKTFDGLSMLIHQALRSYSLWTGREISSAETLEKLGTNVKYGPR